MSASRTHEGVHFRFIIMPCCRHTLCWVNPRLPTFCPECSTLCSPPLKNNPSCIMISDPGAVLTYTP